ncbi:MAG TPA: hypothetical protein VEI80_05630 [Candidatus Acidoferrales bacterium]|nr:hypothetical protein [Candidatus Acidoferrales bacterium]
MSGIRRRHMLMTPLLVTALILVVALPLQVNAASPCKGTWNGAIGPGSGTVSVLGSNQQITTTSTVSGTFEGDTTHGTMVGTINTNYTVPSLSQKGQVSSTVTGSYVMNVASNGTVTGTGSIPLSGGFSGEFKMSFQGQLSQTGALTGTWSGTLTVTQVTYMGMGLGANISAPGSGQFTGTTQS